MDLEYRIGDGWEQGASGKYLLDTSPSDVRQVLTRYKLMSEEQARRAVIAGVDAFPAWRAASPLFRGAILHTAAALLRQRREPMARSIAEENGKTLGEARIEVEKSADFLDFYGSTARLPAGEVIPDSRSGTRAMTLIEPLGLIVIITPWNDPLLTPARKLGPALITGNTVILKPSRETPLAADHLVRALIDAGLPDGVLNTVLTDHQSFEAAVIDHAGLAGISFTGSTEVGLGLSRKLAGRAVRLEAEMGGKNASVVLADADLTLAVNTIAGASFGQSGQRCTATSRVLVESAVCGEFTERLLDKVKELKVGPSLDGATQVGPVVSRRHQATVLAHIGRVQASEAKVACGGGIPTDEHLANGCFISPTVVTGVTAQIPIWRDEIFGPVLGIREIADFSAAVAAVNDSEYGLAAALFTRDLRCAYRFLDSVDAGQVAINLPTSGWDVHQPFGGFKQSGSAFKEQGLEALRFYTRTKMAALRFDW